MQLGLSPVKRLQALLPKYNIGYYIVLSQDAHDSEYVASSDQRRAYLSGFCGSAGIAIVGQDFAELSTDGRYFLEAQQKLGTEWKLRKEGTPGTARWDTALCNLANAERKNIGVDPRLINYYWVNELRSKLKTAELVPIKPNLVDEIWENKPQDPTDGVVELPASVAGETSRSKLSRLRSALDDGVDAIVLSALDEIAWLFNFRGTDIKYNPVFKSYALVTPNEARLYVDPRKVQGLKSRNPHIEFLPYEQIFDDITKFDKVWVPSGSSWALVDSAGPDVVIKPSPVSEFKAVKNSTEQDGARRAQLKCGLSIVRLFSWIEQQLSNGGRVSEWGAAQKLLELREQLDDFRGLSFETISSVGPNAAIIHYTPSEESEFLVDREHVFLLDSGCQFTHGTTDTTRTVHFGNPTSREKLAYTLVLKGHIALAQAVFPEGTAGVQLDGFARQYLWKHGLDYRHGTGHGVGAHLNVHEGPIGISSSLIYGKAPLKVGNIVSNEPGYYEDHKFGIRIENLLLVREASVPNNFGGRQFLEFETITLVPLALNMIDEELLTPTEKEWINAYGQRVRAELSPHLTEPHERAWLEENTRAV